MIVIVLPRSPRGRTTGPQDTRLLESGGSREAYFRTENVANGGRLIPFLMQTNHHVAWEKKKQTRVYTPPTHDKKVGMVDEQWCLVAVDDNLLQNAQERVNSSRSFASTQRSGLQVSILKNKKKKQTKNLLLDQNARERTCKEQQMASPLQKNTTAESQTSLPPS